VLMLFPCAIGHGRIVQLHRILTPKLPLTTTLANGRVGWILLKNSNFVFDHNSRGRGRAPRTMCWGFSRETGFAACRLRMRSDTTIMSGKRPPRAKSVIYVPAFASNALFFHDPSIRSAVTNAYPDSCTGRRKDAIDQIVAEMILRAVR
jgi:hypothetical protein